MTQSIFSYGTMLSHTLVIGADVGVIMGSRSDWETVRPCCEVFEQLGVHFEYGVVSAHRTPERMVSYARGAKERGLQVIIACAGGSAHLPGMTASETQLPVFGFGPTSKTFGPMDVIGSNVRMPAGVPLGFMGLDAAGATNAALMAVRILALRDEGVEARLARYIEKLTADVPHTAHD